MRLDSMYAECQDPSVRNNRSPITQCFAHNAKVVSLLETLRADDPVNAFPTLAHAAVLPETRVSFPRSRDGARQRSTGSGRKP